MTSSSMVPGRSLKWRKIWTMVKLNKWNQINLIRTRNSPWQPYCCMIDLKTNKHVLETTRCFISSLCLWLWCWGGAFKVSDCHYFIRSAKRNLLPPWGMQEFGVELKHILLTSTNIDSTCSRHQNSCHMTFSIHLRHLSFTGPQNQVMTVWIQYVVVGRLIFLPKHCSTGRVGLTVKIWETYNKYKKYKIIMHRNCFMSLFWFRISEITFNGWKYSMCNIQSLLMLRSGI